ncbi:ABC transporter permease [Aureimonas fodinaquatilis]|uniref:ABC transporter permease n=1 Tax=Aureimonas fodinaquatilis TaxID=2565783 RepID=A0A5B0DXM6_9HYPH|nr:ABC transporter permease [Aureimonas fodinaquatilis]KAA0970762.1 ABC transporter permease [Aureimonas fodinaquatilis]
MRAGEKQWVGRALLVLPTAYFLLLVAYPLYILARMSFSRPETGRVFGDGFSVENYIEIFFNQVFLNSLITTARIGALVAFFTLLLAFPLAVFIWRSRSGLRNVVLLITLAPLFISVIVRAYGWMVLLSNRGVVNSALMNMGLIDRPISLIFNETGVIIGTTHVLLPFMVLPILSTLQSIDKSLEYAAASLGARPSRVSLDVIFPLVLPGVVTGLVLVFILAVGSFITPVLLGGQLVLTLPVLALQQFNATFNWALGSAYVVLLLAFVLIITLTFERLVRSSLNKGVQR